MTAGPLCVDGAPSCDNHPTVVNMSESRLIFERQGLHVVFLAGLIVFASWFARHWVSDGHFLGVPASSWFWTAIAVAVFHQSWVWLCWRLQLHKGLLTRGFGATGFTLYAAGFALLAFTRIGVLICLALADRGTVPSESRLLDVLATILLVPIGYLFYSVARYFTFRRALGADHFDPAYRSKPLEKRGIFGFTRNGMYTFGLLLVWLPGLFASSRAALLAAAFNHAYIWVHYFCTELPDMRRIYGNQALRRP